MEEIHSSLCDLGWPQKFDDDVYLILQKNNISNIEIAPSRSTSYKIYENDGRKEVIKKFLNVKRKYNINVCSIQSILYNISGSIFSNDKEIRKNIINKTKNIVDIAYSLNCKNIVFGCPKNRFIENLDNDNYNPYEEYAYQFFLEISRYSKQFDIVFAIEPVTKNYGCNFLTNIHETCYFIDKLNIRDKSTTNIKLNLDTGSCFSNHEIINQSYIEKHFKYITHVHISEINLDTLKNYNIFIHLYKILSNLQYKGFISLEMLTHDKFNLTDFDNLVKSYLKIFQKV